MEARVTNNVLFFFFHFKLIYATLVSALALEGVKQMISHQVFPNSSVHAVTHKPITECLPSSERRRLFRLAPELRRKGGRNRPCLRTSSYFIFSAVSPASPIMKTSGISICFRQSNEWKRLLQSSYISMSSKSAFPTLWSSPHPPKTFW